MTTSAAAAAPVAPVVTPAPAASPPAPAPMADPAAPVAPAVSAPAAAPAPAEPATPAPGAAPPAEPGVTPEAAPAPAPTSLMTDDVDPSKPGNGEPVQPGAAAVEITLPDGVVIDEPLMAAFKGWAAESKLDSEQASTLATLYSKHVSETNAASDAAWVAQGETWAKEIRDDPDLGGQNLKTSMAACQAGLKWAGGDDLGKELQEMGIGNYPGLFKAFHKLGLAVMDDKATLPGTPGGGGGVDERGKLLRAMYPKSFNPDGTPKEGVAV